MAPASPEQIRRWREKINAYPKIEQNDEATARENRENSREYKALGKEEWRAWMEWRREEHDKIFEEHRRHILPEEFVREFKALKYDSISSMSHFRRFLDRINIASIHIGYIKDPEDPEGDNFGTRIMLDPFSGQLDTHPYPDDHDPVEVDRRTSLLFPTVLGLWETPGHFRRGIHSDEGFPEAEHEPRKTPTSSSRGPIRLEVFHQLGKLHYKRFKPDEVVEMEGEESEFEASNYVLVANVYDDSIWVVWNSRPLNQETGDRDPAKDNPDFQKDYAFFPGTKSATANTIIYAKIAEN